MKCPGLVRMTVCVALFGLAACSRDPRRSEREEMLLRMRAPHRLAPANTVEFTIQSAGPIVECAHYVLTKSDGGTLCEEDVCSDLEGFAGSAAGTERMRRFLDRMVYVRHMADDFDATLIRRGVMTDLGRFVSFRIPIRAWWGLHIGEVEVGLFRETGVLAWSVDRTVQGTSP